MNWRVKQKFKLIFFTVMPVLVGIFFVAFFFNQSSIKKIFQSKDSLLGQNEILSNSPEPITDTTPDTKPKYFYFNKGQKEKKPKLSADAYIVGDLNTGEIILVKNQDKQYPIASVSKVMTALVAKDLESDADVARVSARALATYGENGGFYLGEKIKVKDLLYPLLMESSNDAAEILAEYFGRDDFLRDMNEHAQGLKMIKTSYSDPSGLSEKNQSTVEDLFKLAGYIEHNDPDLLKITTNKSYSNKKHTWFSTNQFLSNGQYIGGKSGFTDPALQTVVSLFSLPLGENTSRPIGIVLLHSNDRYTDVNNILKYLKKYVYYGGATDANADWIKEKLQIPDIFDPSFITLTFAGDIMLDRGVKSSVRKNFGGDYSALFDKLDILKNSDIVFANLEGPASDIGTDQKNLYSFRMDPSAIPALKGAGISILNVANNHVGDWGREAFVDTLARLKENEILYTGGGTQVEAETPTIIEKNGMKIGYLGFTDKGPNSMEESGVIPGVLLASNPRFDAIVKNASSLVDYLVVSFHWGEEYKTAHNSRQEQLAHRAIDDGAKIVVGHHPHVMQDFEVYKNGYIVYSLGNFIFDQSEPKETKEGSLLEIELRKDGSLTVRKNIVKINNVFKPDQIIKAKSEAIKFLPWK